MWTRKDLKLRAKINFKSSYLKCVIVCLIFFVISGWKSPATVTYKLSGDVIAGIEAQSIAQRVIAGDLKEIIRYSGNIERVLADEGRDILMALIPSVILVLIVTTIGIAIALLVNLFIIWPLTVGKFRFFMEVREGNDSLDNLIFGYTKDSLKNIFVVLFFKGLYTFLWSLLLIIPGIVKSYEYRMIPYILCENTTIDINRAFEISKNMMRGNKWKAFILDLSFIGWQILSAFTFGLLNVLYVNPYIESTNAELYAFLREEALKSGVASQSELMGF